MTEDDATAAEREARRGIELARRGRARFEEVVGLVLLTQILTRLGRTELAREMLGAAHNTVEACPDPGRLPQLPADVARLVGQQPAQTSVGLPNGQVLSDREMAVLRLLPTERSQREIGEQLYLSFNTVKTHVKSIFRKLDVTSPQEAVRRAHDLGVL